MEHLFKLLILLPCFYFFSWIEKLNRDSKFFPILLFLLGLHHPLCSFSLAWTVISVLFFNIPLRNVADESSHGAFGSLLLLAISRSE